MKTYVYNLSEHLNPRLIEVGGKAANLMKVGALEEVNCPKGFCITTSTYTEVFQENQALDTRLTELTQVKVNDLASIQRISREIREIIVNVSIPGHIVDEIKACFDQLGGESAYAVRSSATAEDLPTASFAGQHDTYLNINGFESILEHISMCWASLFTDRAIVYRIQNSFNHRDVKLAVVVQQMVHADASGVLFTADPMSSNRKVVSIDASIGLGEELVSGHVNTDIYKVCKGKIIEKSISTQEHIAKNQETKQILTDEQILELEKLGRTIESFFSCPQDIEWCITGHQVYIVQSRPVTTLYPIPEVKGDDKRIFMSSGHLQMMTDPIKPLGMYFFKSIINNPPSQEIGGRLYLDMTHDLSTSFGRFISKYLLKELGDTLLTNAVLKVIKNKKLIKQLPKGKGKVFDVEKTSGPMTIMYNAYKAYKKNDSGIVKEIIQNEEKDIELMGQALHKLSGEEVFKYIESDHDNRRLKIASPLNAGVLTAGLLSSRRFDKKVKKWTGVSNAADSIIMSIPNSITTETGLSLMEVTDVIRDYKDIIDYLDHASETTFFEDISKLEGGKAVCDALRKYLSEYGMRCSGDIDITVPRWIENPIELIPSILSNLDNFEPGASKRKFQQGKKESEERIQELIDQVKTLPRGKKKAKTINRLASVIRNYIGFREYPKFSYMKRYYIYKEAMLREAKKLVQKGLLDEPEDIYYLYFEELRGMVNGQDIDKGIISKRKKDYEGYERLTPPRVMTSDGEVITGEYETINLPKNALPGIPVSTGIIEGRARIVKNLKDSYLSEGDILVTEFTDPSWTPTFVSIKGLVTEVGGLSTHGAIIAREYGLPAVVSVTDATKLIQDGQLIRVNGTEGYIEILSES